MMSNLLTMAMIQSILSLHAQGWSQRRIARTLGVDRETVRRYIRGSSKPANAPVGSAGGGGSKPATTPIGSKSADAPLGSGDDLLSAEKPEMAGPGRASD